MKPVLGGLLLGVGVAATALVGSVAALGTGTGVAVAAPAEAPPEPSAEPVPEPEDPREEDENAEEPSAEPAPPPEDPREEDGGEEEPSPDPPPEPSPEPGPEPEDPREDEENEEGPSPAPAPEPEAPSQGEDECGPVDVPCMVVNGFFGWINAVVADFLNSGLMLAGVSMMLMTPSSSGIQSVWEASAGIVNTGFVLIVTAAGVLVMGHQTVQTSAGIKEILPRLVLAFIAVNASWFLCQQLGLLGSSVSVAILGDTADEDSVNQAMARFLSNPRDEGLITVGFMLMSAVAGLIFVFTVIIRLMLWILLTAAAPLALAAHALPQTEGLARLWWRAIGALLVMQVGQALVLRMVMTLFLQREGMSIFDPLGTAGSLIELQVLLACLYVLIRVPFWAGKQIFNPSASPLVKGAKLATSILLFKGMGVGKAAAGQKAGKALTSAKSGAAGPRMAPRPPSGPPPRTPGTPSPPRWRQPELPGMRPRSSAGTGPTAPTQKPLPGIDSQIDPDEQQRLRERRQWVQPPLPSGQGARPPHHRQEALPGMEDTPRAHQDPLPGMSLPAQARQESLFEPTSGMRRPPDQRRSGFQQRQHQAERRRRAARQAAAQQHTPPGRRQIPPRHWGPNRGGRS